MILIGDVLEKLKELSDESVQCVVTSPPYFGLRNYGADGQIGLERTPEEYVEKLVNVFREIRRVLRNDGSMFLNLGDSFAGGGRNAGNSKPHPKATKGLEHLGEVCPSYRGLPAKNLIGIPWHVALALQTDGWFLRCDIIWEKPNCMPDSCKDRPTRSHEYIFLLTKSSRYFYDAKAILEPYTKPMDRWAGEILDAKGKSEWDEGTGQKSYRTRNMRPNPNGRNKRSVWTIPTKSYLGAHFAVFPEALVEPCILAGSKEGGIILDPFAGSGTSLAVAKRLGRSFIGIELNPAYLPLIEKRLKEVPETLPL